MHKTAKISAIIVGVLALPLVQAAPNSLLKALGLHAGQSYGLAKSQLIAKGWMVDFTYAAREAGEVPPYGYKEVICGNGWQAVCSARFLRNGREGMLTLKPRKILVVEDAWDES